MGKNLNQLEVIQIGRQYYFSILPTPPLPHLNPYLRYCNVEHQTPSYFLLFNNIGREPGETFLCVWGKMGNLRVFDMHNLSNEFEQKTVNQEPYSKLKQMLVSKAGELCLFQDYGICETQNKLTVMSFQIATKSKNVNDIPDRIIGIEVRNQRSISVSRGSMFLMRSASSSVFLKRPLLYHSLYIDSEAFKNHYSFKTAQVEVRDLKKHRRDPNLAIPDRRDIILSFQDWGDQNLAIEDLGLYFSRIRLGLFLSRAFGLFLRLFLNRLA